MNVTELSQSITRQISEATEAGAHIVALFDSLPPEVSSIESATCYASLSTHSLVITLPFDRSMMRAVRDAMQRDGWKLIYKVDERDVSNKESGKPTESYCICGKSGEVTFFWSSDRDGSTCRHVKIGTTMQEIPVYEFSCEVAQ